MSSKHVVRIENALKSVTIILISAVILGVLAAVLMNVLNENKVTSEIKQVEKQTQKVIVKVASAQSSSEQEYELDLETDNEVLESALDRLSKGTTGFTLTTADFPGIGKYIVTINGVTTNPSTQFWEISHNGNPAQVGISELTLSDGDVIDLKLVTF